MKYKWVIPAVILILLLFALAFRWNYVAYKSHGTGVIKWKIDRWSGQKWIEHFGIDVMEETPVIEENDLLKRIDATTQETSEHLKPTGPSELDYTKAQTKAETIKQIFDTFSLEQAPRDKARLELENDIWRTRRLLYWTWCFLTSLSLLWFLYSLKGISKQDS